MVLKIFQEGFNYGEDGDGNRLVVHLAGCNLRCPWCSNPEGLTADHAKTTDTDALFEKILSCRRLFIDGGGVTFTGGECTLQPAALFPLLCRLRAAGVHTAIETNGTFPYDAELFKNVDLLICDMKHYDEKKLSAAVGNAIGTRKNVADYLAFHDRVWVRVPLVHGFNDGMEDAENFAAFFASVPKKNAAFEFLPYHEYGRDKWRSLGMEYTVKDGFTAPDTVEKFEKVFRDFGLTTMRS